MIRFLISSMLTLLTITSYAQYTPAEPDSLKCTLKEMRQMLSGSDVDTEYYQLAKAARKDQLASAGFFTLGMLCFMTTALCGGIVLYGERFDTPWGTGLLLGSGATILTFSLGTRHYERFEQKLDKACRLYHQR